MAGTSNLFEGIGGVANAYNQTQSLALQGEFQQKMFERNQKLADMQADDALKRGDLSASKYKKQVNQVIGEQRASFAAQGIDPSSGSAADITAESSKFGALDQLTIKTNAWREAYGYKMNAEIAGLQMGMGKVATQNQMLNTALTGGIGFLSSSAKAASIYSGGSAGGSFNWAGGSPSGGTV